MKRRLIYIVLVISAFEYSCSLLKDNQTTKKEKSNTIEQRTDLKETQESEKSKRSADLTLSKIFDQSAYRMQLYPSGKIIYTANSGFEGEFDSIMMSGYLQKSVNTAVVVSLEEKEKENRKLQVKQNMQSKSAEVVKTKKSAPNWFFVCFGSLLILVGCFFLYKKLVG